VSHSSLFPVAHKSRGKRLKAESEGSRIDRIFHARGAGGMNTGMEKTRASGAAMKEKCSGRAYHAR
jgi:hypothetical protein